MQHDDDQTRPGRIRILLREFPELSYAAIGRTVGVTTTAVRDIARTAVLRYGDTTIQLRTRPTPRRRTA